MVSPSDIICFAKDWSEPATSNNHVMEELARQGHRVLWVNPLAMRTPNLGSAHDVRKIWRKVRGWCRGVQPIHEKLRVLSPVLVPLPHSRFAQAFNRWFVTKQVRRAARRWGFRQPQLWIFPPNAVDFVDTVGESLVVYYCTDEWSQFGYLDGEFIRQKEAELLRRADVVFVTSQKLLDTKGPHSPNTHLIPHGVNCDLFAQALSPDLPIPADLQQIRSHPSSLIPHPSPTIGFYGNLYDWVDQDLIAGMAKRRPEWSFVLVGKIMTDVSRLQQHSNIHLMGKKPYEELPGYCKGFDVGLIPYKLDDPRMATVNPLKLREYLAAGLAVVSVDMPEVRALGEHVRIASGVDGFVKEIEELLETDSTERRRVRSAAMHQHSWTARVQEMERIIGPLRQVSPPSANSRTTATVS